MDAPKHSTLYDSICFQYPRPPRLRRATTPSPITLPLIKYLRAPSALCSAAHEKQMISRTLCQNLIKANETPAELTGRSHPHLGTRTRLPTCISARTRTHTHTHTHTLVYTHTNTHTITHMHTHKHTHTHTYNRTHA